MNFQCLNFKLKSVTLAILQKPVARLTATILDSTDSTESHFPQNTQYYWM